MRLHRLARVDLAIFIVTAVLALCLSSFLAGAYLASNHRAFANCFITGGGRTGTQHDLFPGGTPCGKLSGEQRAPAFVDRGVVR